MENRNIFVTAFYKLAVRWEWV